MPLLPDRQLLDDPAVQREWQTLSRRMRLAASFSFIVYFVPNERVALALRELLRDSLQARSAHLTVIAPETPEAMVHQALEQVFESADLPAHRDACAPFWLEAYRGADLPEWETARRELLMRCNERRSRLELEVKCPLILLLPPGWERGAAMLAPDLWHVRTYSASLPVEAAQTPGPLVVGPLSRLEEGTRLSRASRPRVASRVAAKVWQELQEKQRRDQSWLHRILSRFGIKRQISRVIGLWDGFEAVNELTSKGLWNQAKILADELLDLARSQGENPSALRDLSVSLNKVGNVAEGQGRLDTAQRAYEESLQIRRRLLSAQGESPSSLRDLSVSLKNVGDVALKLGRLEAAQRVYDESLEIDRILSAQGVSDSALGDLGASLTRVGDVALDQGRLEAAQRVYEESLDIRRLVREQGESPRTLRDLSVSLSRVGEVSKRQGRLDAAQRAYDEGLGIHRRLLREQGESPNALRDLSVSLSNVGEVSQRQGRLDAAQLAYDESLDIHRRLLGEQGESPTHLDDLAETLERMASLPAKDVPLRDIYLRDTHLQEALRIRRRLVKVFPDSDYHAGRLQTTENFAASLRAEFAKPTPIENSGSTLPGLTQK